MKTMKSKLFLIAAAVCALLTSCSSTKKVTQSESTRSDTSKTILKLTVRDSVYLDRLVEKHDTVIVVKGLAIGKTLAADALDQAQTKDGKPVTLLTPTAYMLT
jgi:ABC-type enterochelin transport system substrate-binding protein